MPQSEQDIHWIRYAMQLAERAEQAGEVPVGAVPGPAVAAARPVDRQARDIELAVGGPPHTRRSSA